MKKVQIVYKRNAIAQSGAPLNLEYLLTCRELPDSVPEHGVGIRVLTPDSCEEDCADGITPRRERAMELLRLLADGTTTPVTLRDILQDVL